MKSPIEIAAHLLTQIKARHPEMDADFAEGIAHHMVLTGERKISRCRMAVWLAGPAGLAAMKTKVAAL